jgi:hypothetical protein
MKKNYNLNTMRIALFSALMLLITFTGCKKDEPEVIVAPYSPTFTAASIPLGGGNFDFILTSVTDDVELVSLTITAPAGIGSDTYPMNGFFLLRNTPSNLGVAYPIVNGAWTINIRGTLKSGTAVGESFDVTISVNVS